MSRYLYLLLGCLLFLCCRKLENVQFSTPLAVDSRIVRIAATADTTKVIVYSDGDWQVTPAAETPWILLRQSAGHGKGYFIAEATDNSTALPRAVKLVINSNGHTDTVQIQQRGLVPALAIADTTAQAIANGGLYRTGISTNVPLALQTAVYRYDSSGAGWISQLDIRDGYLYFHADTNHLAVDRVAVLTLSYLDALGTTTKDSIKIKQKAGISFDGAVARDFSYVKSLAPGVINENSYIEGIVVSDKGHPNIAQNLNSAANKHVVDKTENSIAVYVQSTDGSNGLYLKMKTAGENIFNFNDRVKIHLKGATLQKLANPARSIISGVEISQVMQKDAGTTALQPKEKYISELTDNDLYTYVKLRDVEFSIPFGAYTNINEGYTARMDCYPLSIRDIQGNSMYLLTNLDVAYRRDGKPIPQGAGAIAGILVSENHDRYGGNIGRYSLRHLWQRDITLNADRSNGFHAVLVEWTRFKTEYQATPTEAQNPLTPDIGSGKLYHSSRKSMDFTANGIYTTVDYNNVLQEPTTNKGQVTNSGWGAKGWWNTTTNTGEYWMVETSSKGVTQPLSLQLDGNVDPGGPRNFVVEYSATNSNWITVGTFTFQDVANWTNTLLTQVAGFKQVNMQLPAGASNLDKLYIRIRMADKTVGSGTAATGGAYSATAACRLGHLSLKYNK